jgi:hypothetical protein
MPKSYSQYKYQDIATLGLALREAAFIQDIPPLVPSDFLKEMIKINTKRIFTTEKSKSEFIIAPILFEIARRNDDIISFFSGNNLDVNKDLGLKGFCDFLFSKTPRSPIIEAPIFCLVEAKNDNLERGIPQCIAEMYASRLFNQRQNKPIELIVPRYYDLSVE